MNRITMGNYGSTVNTNRRLKELKTAFERESGWIFERESVQGDNRIMVTYPDGMCVTHEDVGDYIRKKSIESRKKIREADVKL